MDRSNDKPRLWQRIATANRRAVEATVGWALNRIFKAAGLALRVFPISASEAPPEASAKAPPPPKEPEPPHMSQKPPTSSENPSDANLPRLDELVVLATMVLGQRFLRGVPNPAWHREPEESPRPRPAEPRSQPSRPANYADQPARPVSSPGLPPLGGPVRQPVSAENSGPKTGNRPPGRGRRFTFRY